ncbi:MAG: PAS domain S-box protein [Chloroflexi bacterium]|nr:PAS domain S-box protein [Chloroflexota bacterium]
MGNKNYLTGTQTSLDQAQILVVEDELILAEDMRSNLIALGYSVPDVVVSGEEAVCKADEMRPDLVLMDIKLQGEMDGVEAAEQIRTRFDIPVIYITAFSDDVTLQRSKIAEPFGYVLKPIETRELYAAVEMALYRHKLETRLKENERWLDTTLRSIGDGVIATDDVGRVVFMNPVAEGLTGWRQAEAVGQDLSEVFCIVNEATRETVENPAARVLWEGAVVGLANHTLLIRKDGVEIPIDDSGAPIRDDKGAITGVVLTFRDITKRKEAGAALLESMEALDQVFQHAVDPIYRYNLITTAYDYFSPSCIKTHGYTPEEMIAGGIEKEASRIHPDDLITLQEHVDDLLSGTVGQEIQQVIEYRFKHKTRGYRWLSDSRSILYDASGTPIAIFGGIRDITERKRTEQTLECSEQFLSDLLNHIPDPIFVKDEQHRWIMLNDAYCKASGYSREELLGKSDHDFYPKEQADIFWEKDNLVFESTLAYENEETFTDAKGNVHTILTKKAMFKDSSGAQVLVGIAHDITERVRAEDALNETLERLKGFDTHSTEGVYRVDIAKPVPIDLPRAEIVDWINKHSVVGEANDSLAQMYGIEPQDMIGRPAIDFAPNYGERAVLVLEREGYRVINEETEDVDKDGNALYLVENYHGIVKDGYLVAIWGAQTNITERKRLEKQLRQHERLAAVGQMAAGIAHDFRNLLTTIILYANMGLRKPDLPPNLIQNLETIIGESKKAADLVQQILDFSSRAMIQVQPLDIKSFIEEIADILRRTIPENVHLVLETRPEARVIPLMVEADPTRIQQALMNLATNARDAMPNGGELRFKLSRIEFGPDDELPVTDMQPGEWVCLAVSDTGEGMTEDVRAHLFEPFFTTKEVGKGTGLGLAQVYGIVRQHEGYVSVETEVGKGTTFHIYLPATRAETEVVEEDASPMPQGRGEIILLVEDNERLQVAGQNILELLGYRVLVAANGREALEVYQAKGGVDLVITDMVMPEMGGKELVQELSKVDPNLKAIGVTGYVAEKVAVEPGKVGFLDVIHKPFDVETLARVIRCALDAD